MAQFDDLDPAGVHTLEDLAALLRQVRTRADGPSLRDLEQRARRSRRSLPRSSIADMLSAKRLPKKELLFAYLETCGANPTADPRWLLAWNRLAAPESDPNPAADHVLAIDNTLINDVRAAGLTRIGATYMTSLEWSRLFAGVHELDIYVAYGQTWTRMNGRDLARLSARPSACIRVILADPDDDLTVTVLARRFNLTTDELRHRIHGTHADYTALRGDGATVEIYYWSGDRTFSFYRFDDTAVIGLYSHSRTRAASVPVFVCQQPGDLYDFVLNEWAAVLRSARPA